METPNPEELKIPNEAIIEPSKKAPLPLIIGGSLVTLLILGTGSYFFFQTRSTPAVNEPAFESPLLTPDSEALNEARFNLPVTDSAMRPGTMTGSTSEPLFQRAAPIELPQSQVSFTPSSETEETPATQVTEAATIQNAIANDPNFNRTTNPEAVISAPDDTVKIVAPITVTNTTHTGDITPRTIEGLVRNIDADTGVLLIGYAGEAGTLVEVTPDTQYRIDGQPTVFGALTRSDIVRVVGSGYAASATMEATEVSIIGTYERVDQGSES